MSANAQEPAVQLKRVYKSYGFYKNRVPVLTGIELNVPKGRTYGLLGSSGCGKSTLLKCVIGRIQIDSGVIRVFGRIPGASGFNIPGSGVGYMPQELALCNDLTTRETLNFFGNLHSMHSQRINERISVLIDFLNLPTEWKLIKNLSGGQKRRVSLAIALFHEPPLLILDEPTVGVDPILRQNIWDHLLEVSSSGNTTTIITTHYIEETTRANIVALMRNGKICVEGEPRVLLQNFGLSTLEATVLKLCYEDEVVRNEMFDGEMADDAQRPLLEVDQSESEEYLSECGNYDWKKWFSVPNPRRIRALVVKNFTKVPRKLIGFIFQFLLPTIEVILFCVITRGMPNNLDVGVMNEDSNLGIAFLTHIDNFTINQVPINSFQTAEKLLDDGKIWAWIHIWPNYTDCLAQRVVTQPENLTDDIEIASTIHVKLGKGDHLVTHTVQNTISNSFHNFIDSIRIQFGLDSQTIDMPLEFGEPPSSSRDNFFFDYLVPGHLILIVYAAIVGLTIFDCMAEQNEGLVDRNYVAGVGNFELIFSRVVTELVLIVGQMSLVAFVLVDVYGFTCRGNIAWIILLLILQGMVGLAFGILLSTSLRDQSSATIVALSCVLFTLMLSGVISSVEAMPDIMKTLCRLLPHTDSMRALRSILLRGRGVFNSTVWRGIFSSLIWMFIYFASAVIVLSVRR